MENKKTVLYDDHVALGAKMVDFAGYMMPIQYPAGIITEHLSTRKHAGLFDVSHMGRFEFTGKDTLAFLQHTLTNNAAALEFGTSQYTIISDDNGFAIDDAYLYRFYEDRYLLVVNAASKEKDWKHLQSHIDRFSDVQMSDITDELAMISLQGPASKQILNNLITEGSLPEPMRNRLSIVQIKDCEILLGRTGYTGEPICFELFIKPKDTGKIWKMLIENNAHPVGLGARDTLRLEAALPLYGREFGLDPQGKQIPIFACPLARFAVSFSELKGDFIGKEALNAQFVELKKIRNGNFSSFNVLPRKIIPIALMDKGIARAGDKIFIGDKYIGHITSGTMVPYWETEGSGLHMELSNNHSTRAIGLALIDSDIHEGRKVQIEVRGKRIDAVVVSKHLNGKIPPYAYPVIYRK